MIDGIVEWLNTYESALSAVAALIVIGTVAATLGRHWLKQNRSAQNNPQTGAQSSGRPTSGASSGSATAGTNLRPVTDKPSIAVLPFENTSNDPSNEAAADGLTTEIIAGLSANRQLFVIARNSCFSYKGRSVDVRDVARELGVRYVLEGTVRPRDGRVRVSAQLIDATTGATTWSQRFDVAIDDIFDLDDVVTSEIVATLVPELRRAEAARARDNPVGLDTWARVNSAWLDLQNDLSNQNVAADVIARLENVIKEAPDFALAHAVLAHAYSLSFPLGSEEEARTHETHRKSLDHSKRAIDLDPNDAAIRHLVGAALSNYRLSEDAQRAYEKALDLNPEYAPALGSLGVSLMYSGRTQEAISLIERALRLSPREPQAYHWQSHLALANVILGSPARALEFAKTALERRGTMMGRIALLIAHALLGNTAEADEAAKALRASLPTHVTRTSFDDLVDQLVKDEDRRTELKRAMDHFFDAPEDTDMPQNTPS